MQRASTIAVPMYGKVLFLSHEQVVEIKIKSDDLYIL